MPFSNKPLYLQARDVLADLISRGAWKRGTQIPSEGELARDLGVSPGTIRKALELLQAQRLIVRRQGRGTFVNDPSPDELAFRYVKLHSFDGECLHGQQVRPAEVRQCAADEMERRRLRLRAGAEVYRIRRARHHEGRCFLLEDAALPEELFPGLFDGEQNAFDIATLARQYGIILGKAEERISMRLPPRDVAEIMDAPLGKPTIHLDRIVMLPDGRPAEWRIAHCHMDQGYYLAEWK